MNDDILKGMLGRYKLVGKAQRIADTGEWAPASVNMPLFEENQS